MFPKRNYALVREPLSQTDVQHHSLSLPIISYEVPIMVKLDKGEGEQVQ